MIPKPYIAAWQSYVPWKEFAQVEQDLIISRTLVEIFSPFAAASLTQCSLW